MLDLLPEGYLEEIIYKTGWRRLWGRDVSVKTVFHRVVMGVPKVNLSSSSIRAIRPNGDKKGGLKG